MTQLHAGERAVLDLLCSNFLSGLEPAAARSLSRPEVYARRVHGAVTFLRGRSFSCRRADRDDPVSGWHVSGYPGELDNEQLVDLAVHYGFEPAA